MLARNEQNPTNTNPFGLVQQQQEPQELEQKDPPENNKTCSFRRAGNVCEIAAGACLNSAVVFTFHLMQVHPPGIILALGVAHLYLSATAAGESRDKLVTNFMTGASASLALVCAVSEPIGEWWEASQSKNNAIAETTQMYEPVKKESSVWVNPVVIAVVLGLVAIWITSAKRIKN
ncbi:hypothetical protein [Nostoc sp. FACHB-110]|uniref:hypothetical protein n=1 Tax=Nostoc sp. FACHB-110 TaxID=2692834 RepID=UPI001685B2CE|nr:hypothetical protein [Nostoc sp. FACHB-110]MBD2437327.1 hypothetical protein [Nostoc sp. FACHB-110]